MSDSDRVGRFLRLRRKNGEWRVDPRLREKLLQEEDGSLAAAINRILCEVYGIEHRPTGKNGNAESGADKINLIIQGDLDKKLMRVAAQRGRGWTVQDEIMATLSRHYGLPMPGITSRAA